MNEPMAVPIASNPEQSAWAQLPSQSARLGRLPDEEARDDGVGSRIHAHFAHLGGVELGLPVRANQGSS